MVRPVPPRLTTPRGKPAHGPHRHTVRPMTASARAATNERLRRTLAERSMRLTGPRQALLDAVASAPRPQTVEQLRKASGSPLSTLYRNLDAMVEAGVLKRIAGPSAPAWELSDDFAPHHHHLLCHSCETIVDIDLPDDAERMFRDLATDLAATHGWSAIRHRVDFVGECPTCADAD